MAYEQQRQVNQFKDQFIMNVSHELRTPLTSISGYLELLKEYRDHIDMTTQTTFLNKAIEGCDELTHLVNSVLDAITVSNEIQPALCEIVSVSEAVTHTIEHLDPREIGEYTIITDVPSSLEVWADMQYLRQVLRNLLSNAFKYSPPHTSITITARQIIPEHIGDDPLVQISIKDEGLGIPEDETALLFEKFVRLKRDLAGLARGTGLGLYITRQLVEAMAGHIRVESTGKAGEGSSFHFTLPCASPLSPHEANWQGPVRINQL
jgi:signal transduction histidine kinase